MGVVYTKETKKTKNFVLRRAHLASTTNRQGARGRSAGFQTCCIADFQVGRAPDAPGPAGLETRDTADLEVCATVVLARCALLRPRTSNNGPGASPVCCLFGAGGFSFTPVFPCLPGKNKPSIGSIGSIGSFSSLADAGRPGRFRTLGPSRGREPTPLRPSHALRAHGRGVIYLCPAPRAAARLRCAPAGLALGYYPLPLRGRRVSRSARANSSLGRCPDAPPRPSPLDTAPSPSYPGRLWTTRPVSTWARRSFGAGAMRWWIG
jgi:hypothetical protein